jgi:tripartite-type tricarboxylate transporter receptor subunit TctC
MPSKLRCFAAIGFLAASSFALAQQRASTASYPERPVRVVVPVAPGGSTDLQARIMATKLSEALGTPFIVDNRPGAGAMIGAAIVAKATPDGYTLLFGQAGHTIAPFIYSKVCGFAASARLSII